MEEKYLWDDVCGGVLLFIGRRRGCVTQNNSGMEMRERTEYLPNDLERQRSLEMRERTEYQIFHLL